MREAFAVDKSPHSVAVQRIHVALTSIMSLVTDSSELPHSNQQGSIFVGAFGMTMVSPDPTCDLLSLLESDGQTASQSTQAQPKGMARSEAG